VRKEIRMKQLVLVLFLVFVMVAWMVFIGVQGDNARFQREQTVLDNTSSIKNLPNEYESVYRIVKIDEMDCLILYWKDINDNLRPVGITCDWNKQ